MRFFIKNKGGSKAEAWIEDWLPKSIDWEVVAVATLIVTKDQCLIDTIDTDPKYRRRGYASAIVKELQQRFTEVAPIGVVPTTQGFWDKFGMVDALGEERDE